MPDHQLGVVAGKFSSAKKQLTATLASELTTAIRGNDSDNVRQVLGALVASGLSLSAEELIGHIYKSMAGEVTA